MKKIFSLFAAVLFVGSMFAADEVYKQTVFSAANNDESIQDYTSTWTNTTDGFVVTVVNANNNRNGWSGHIKMGRKNTESVGSIATKAAIDKAITKVAVTIDAITAAKINSLKLYLSEDGSEWVEEGSFDKATGEKEVAIAAGHQAANRYYKFVADCASGSSNGLIEISKVQFYVHKEVAVENPVIAGDADFFESVEVSISCATDGAAIHYTLDGSDPTSESTLYSAPFTLTESKTVKAIAIKGTDKSEIVVKEFAIHPVFASIEALVEADLATGNLVKVSFEDARIDSVFTTKGGDKRGIYVDVKDKTGLKGIEIYYGSGAIPAAWEIGGKVSGTVVATWTLYYGQWEIVPSSADWKWTDLTYKDAPTALDNTNADTKVEKFFRNGQLIIRKNGVEYNALGTQL